MPAPKHLLSIKNGRPIYIRTVSRDAKWVPVGGTIMLSENGHDIPTKRFIKDIIRTGHYTQVTNKGEFEFLVNKGTLNHWVARFAEMKANGVRVSIPKSHETVGDSDSNLGWVDEMWVEGDRLWMSCTMIGDDAILAAARCDVSISSEPEYKDGSGNTYHYPIDHVAMTPTPVIPKLGEFIPIAASRDPTLIDRSGDRTMPKTPEQITAGLIELLDIDADTDAAKGPGLRKAVVASMNDLFKGESDTIVIGGKIKAPEKVKDGTIAKFSKETGLWVSIGTGDPKKNDDPKDKDPAGAEPNILVVKTVALARLKQIECLVKDRKLSIAQAEILKEQFIGANDTHDAVVLELSRNSDGAAFDQAIRLAEMNQSIAWETSGPQHEPGTYKLSDQKKGGEIKNAQIEHARAAGKAAAEASRSRR